MPGATLAIAVTTRVAASSTQDHGGDHPSGSSTRRPPDRRAGSANHASTDDRSTSRTSPQRTSTRSSSPSASTLAAANAAASGSRSTASTRRPAWASARVSEPAPQPRSATREPGGKAAAKRAARRAATAGRVACSRVSGDHQSRSAAGPNRSRARVRSRACDWAAATSAAGWPRRRAAWPAARAPASSYGVSEATRARPSGVSRAASSSGPTGAPYGAAGCGLAGTQVDGVLTPG